MIKLLCEVCKQLQTLSPSGVTCPVGHGGANTAIACQACDGRGRTKLIGARCLFCKGSGYQPLDPGGDYLDHCEKCGATTVHSYNLKTHQIDICETCAEAEITNEQADIAARYKAETEAENGMREIERDRGTHVLEVKSGPLSKTDADQVRAFSAATPDAFRPVLVGKAEHYKAPVRLESSGYAEARADLLMQQATAMKRIIEELTELDRINRQIVGLERTPALMPTKHKVNVFVRQAGAMYPDVVTAWQAHLPDLAEVIPPLFMAAQSRGFPRWLAQLAEEQQAPDHYELLILSVPFLWATPGDEPWPADQWLQANKHKPLVARVLEMQAARPKPVF